MTTSVNSRSAELISAIQNQQIGIVRRLLREGVSPHARDEHHFPALSLAAHLDDYDCVRALLDAGADPNARDYGGYTPLMHVGSAKVAKALLDAGAEVNAESDNCQTPLSSAVTSAGAAEVVALLLERGAVVPEILGHPSYWTRYGERLEPVRRAVFAHLSTSRIESAMIDRPDTEQSPSIAAGMTPL